MFYFYEKLSLSWEIFILSKYKNSLLSLKMVFSEKTERGVTTGCFIYYIYMMNNI